MARIVPTEHTLGSIPSAKRCHRTCAHPPVVCLLRLLFTGAKVYTCLPVFWAPSSFIWVLVFGGFSFLSFSLFKQKSCGDPRCLEQGCLSRQLMHRSRYICCFPGRTLRSCLLGSVSMFPATPRSCSGSSRGRGAPGTEWGWPPLRGCLAAAGRLSSSFTRASV